MRFQRGRFFAAKSKPNFCKLVAAYTAEANRVRSGDQESMERRLVCNARHTYGNVHGTTRCGWKRAQHSTGFTVIELLIAMLILGTLASIALPKLQHAIEKARVAKAIGDLRALSSDLGAMDPTPNTLAEAGRGGMTDPWGTPYQFQNLGGGGGGRVDKFGIDLNQDFDLYSMGPDGVSAPSLSAAASMDDLVRANDGGYVGKASTY